MNKEIQIKILQFLYENADIDVTSELIIEKTGLSSDDYYRNYKFLLVLKFIKCLITDKLTLYLTPYGLEYLEKSKSNFMEKITNNQTFASTMGAVFGAIIGTNLSKLIDWLMQTLHNYH